VAARTWSLANRVTLWSTGLGTGFVALLAVIGGVLVHFETRESLDSIATEEMEEMIGAFRTSRGTREDFAIAAEALQRSHPDDAMAWRVWDRSDGSVWGSFGHPELLRLLPQENHPPSELDRAHRHRAGELDARLSLALLLEGGREVAAERRFWIAAGLLVLVAAGASYLAGRLLARRICAALETIAAGARAEEQTAGATTPEGLPVEMHAVVGALRQTLARIRVESERTRVLASGLAHELRSPLHNMRLQIEVLQLRERRPEEYREAQARLLLDLEELIRAIDNLVVVCAGEPLRGAPPAQELDLAEAARLALRGDLQRAGLAGVEVRVMLPERLRVRGVRDLLTLALRNLVANAIDWSPRAGVVGVSAQVVGSTLQLRVTDQGPGVPEADRERVFQAFERGPSPPGNRVGYGLGLALVRIAAEAHGGRAWVESAPGGGACFVLELPQPRVEERAAVEPALAQRAAEPGA
jgi:signal transduction histidine kinase